MAGGESESHTFTLNDDIGVDLVVNSFDGVNITGGSTASTFKKGEFSDTNTVIQPLQPMQT